MEPLNTQERNSALIKFIAFFVVAMVLVVSATFFDFLFGKKAQDARRVELIELRESADRMKRMVPFMDSLRVHIGRITEGYSILKGETEARRYIDSLARFKNDLGISGELATRLDPLYLSFLERSMNEANAKKNGETLGDLKNDVKELEGEIKDLEKEIKDKDDEIRRLKD